VNTPRPYSIAKHFYVAKKKGLTFTWIQARILKICCEATEKYIVGQTCPAFLLSQVLSNEDYFSKPIRGIPLPDNPCNTI